MPIRTAGHIWGDTCPYFSTESGQDHYSGDLAILRLITPSILNRVLSYVNIVGDLETD